MWLTCSGARWTTTTNAMSMPVGALSKKVCKAVVPPADAPMPTTGNDRSLFNVAGDESRSLRAGACRAIEFS